MEVLVINMKVGILSKRGFESWPSYHLVYEWEDVFNEKIQDSSIICESKYYSRILYKFFSKLNIDGRILETKKLYIKFDMSVRIANSQYNRKNVIPIIIDYFISDDKIDAFKKAYSRNPVVIITSKEVYEHLKEKEVDMNIKHIPLSLPDKYRLNEKQKFIKKYDFVLFGRQNAVLKNYLEQYGREHSDILYVTEGKEKFHYFTNKGDYVGFYKSRKEYIDLMKLSRMALYSTPSMDDSRKNTNGFNQVTPKFLEYLSCGCQLLMRYPDNPDTEYYELRKFCPSIDSYDEFKSMVEKYKSQEVDLSLHSQYLQKHYTSLITEEIKDIIDSLWKE